MSNEAELEKLFTSNAQPTMDELTQDNITSFIFKNCNYDEFERLKKYYNISSDLEMANHVNDVLKQMTSDENGNQYPIFIKVDSKGKERISTPLLAQTFREQIDYVLVKSPLADYPTMYIYNEGKYTMSGKSDVQAKIKRFITSYNINLLKMSYVEEAYKDLMTDDGTIQHSALNSNDKVINFKNGVYNIETGELQPHSKDLLSTIQIPCNYNPVAEEPTVFLKFIDDISNHDEEKKKLLKQYLAACISNIPGRRFKKALFLFGEGNTGKSQILNLLIYLIGKENYANLPFAKLEDRFALASTFGKRLVGDGEASFSYVPELRNFKAMVGDDELRIEYKGKDAFSSQFTGMCLYCSNQLSNFGGDKGQWVYERIIPFRCDNPIPADKQDKLLIEKLKAEREQIVNYLIDELRAVIDNGYQFDIPTSCKEELENYKKQNSTVLQFLDECCDTTKPETDSRMTITRVYEIYRNYCKDNGYKNPPSKKTFEEEIAKSFYHCKVKDIKRKTNKAWMFIFTINDDVKTTYGYRCF